MKSNAQKISGQLLNHFKSMAQVRMLLDEGADKGLVDLQGMTAKDHAKEKECVTIIGKVDVSVFSSAETSKGHHNLIHKC